MSSFTLRVVTGVVLLALFTGTFWVSPLALAGAAALILAYVAYCELPLLLPVGTVGYWLVLGGYLIFPLVSFTKLLMSDCCRWQVLFLVGAAVIFDTFSYLMGKAVGRTKIAPTISPGKTWEGFAGGCAALGAYVWLALRLNALQPDFFSYLLLVVGLAGAAFAGDLFESWLKRRARIKDTGTLLPGHGGVLDRIDSLLAIFAVWQLGLRHFLP
jgi:phosphatidate cytidylyltransferase